MMASPEAQQQEQAKSGLGWNSHTRAAHAQGGPLGRVPARLPRLLGACPAALGSVALPEGEAGQPLPRVLELVDAARTRRRSRRLPDDAGTWTRRRRRWSRTTRATCPTPTWRCAAASRPTAEGRRSASPNPNQPLTTHHSTSNLQPSTFNLHPTLTLTHPLSLKPHPQDEICKAVEELDGGKFQQDTWTRAGGGGGISRVMTDGNVFEKAGCSLSVVYGSMPQEALASATGRGADRAKGYAEGARSTRKVGPHDVLAKWAPWTRP